ncbi:MAG: phage tail protein [Candidatus Bathyarchaeia archaeon]|jgi:phage tail-like protein
MSTPKSSQRKDPYPNYRFVVEIAGVVQANFCEVILPESASDVIAVRDGTESSFTVKKQAGLVNYGSLILKSGLTSSLELYMWRKMIEQGKINSTRRNIAVVLFDEESKDVARWEFTNAWPSKYKGPDLNAQGNEIAIETLEIVFESMQRVK